MLESIHGKVLWVGHSAWVVTDREAIAIARERGGRTRMRDVAMLSGGAGHLCPGDSRATWWCLGAGRRREDEGMRVVCEQHVG